MSSLNNDKCRTVAMVENTSIMFFGHNKGSAVKLTIIWDKLENVHNPWSLRLWSWWWKLHPDQCNRSFLSGYMYNLQGALLGYTIFSYGYDILGCSFSLGSADRLIPTLKVDFFVSLLFFKIPGSFSFNFLFLILLSHSVFFLYRAFAWSFLVYFIFWCSPSFLQFWFHIWV